MDVSEVRIRLSEDDEAEKLRAFATITLDGEFVVRDIKIIEGGNGLFLAMPSRRIMEKCRKCGVKNGVPARFCNECGTRLPQQRRGPESGRPKIFVDVAHPITPACRERIHAAVIQAYENALAHAREAGPSPLDSPAESAEKEVPAENAGVSVETPL
jgi:stage V sporulation protein G